MHRKLSRRDSEMILSEGPITPPESPGPESKAPGLADQQSLQQLHHQTQTQVNTNVVNTDQSKQSLPHIDYPATPVSQVPETPDGRDEDMEVEAEVDSHYLAISKQPVRTLSSENLQSSSSDSLKLTDFEVRGTLGMSSFFFFSPPFHSCIPGLLEVSVHFYIITRLMRHLHLSIICSILYILALSYLPESNIVIPASKHSQPARLSFIHVLLFLSLFISASPLSFVSFLPLKVILFFSLLRLFSLPVILTRLLLRELYTVKCII